MPLPVVNPVCAGVDIDTKRYTVCVCIHNELRTQAHYESKSFTTTHSGRMELVQWLLQHGCTSAAMESTGVYWKPLYHVLVAAGIEAVVANPAHVRIIPGKKTDQKDAHWLAQLHSAGLIKGSFVPPLEIERLRRLMRKRVSYVEQKTRARNWMLGELEREGIRLTQVVSKISTQMATRIVRALADGEHLPEELAKLRHGNAKASPEEFVEALRGVNEGPLPEFIRMQLDQDLRTVEHFDQLIAEIDRSLDEFFRPYEGKIRNLTSIHSIGVLAARTAISEIGIDMTRFRSHKHCTAWAGLSPGNNESAGKRKNGRTGRGNKALKRILVQCAWRLSTNKELHGTWLHQLFERLRVRIGGKKAAVAVAHRLLVLIWHVLAEDTPYDEARQAHVQHERRQHIRDRSMAETLRARGWNVTAPQAAGH